MFPMTLTLHNASELTAVLAALGVTTSAAPEAPAEPAKAEKPKAEPVVLTKTQTDAMDDTAGLTAEQRDALEKGHTVALSAKQMAALVEEASAKKPSPATPAPSAPTASAAQAAAPEQKAVTYADLQAAVLRLHKADATAAKPIAEAMGFANFKAMPEDKWPEALAKVQAALSERGV